MRRFALITLACLMILALPWIFSTQASEIPANTVTAYNGKPISRDIIQIYGHRAARGLLPEQTMPAYSAALRLGVDYVDMDVGLSKDGVLVVTHDLGLNPNLTRDAQGRWVEEAIPIRSMTVRQIQSYDVGRIKPGTQYAGFFPDQKPVAGARIPTLKEVVDYVKRIAGNTVGFQIEIKNDPGHPELSAGPEDFAQALCKLIKAEGIGDRTEVQAFDWNCLIAIKKLDPNIKCAFLTDHETDNPNSGLWTAGLKPAEFGGSFPRMIKRLGGDCWEPFEGDLTRKDLDEAHKLGLKVVVWGWPEVEGSEFNAKAVARMIDWGVDGVISDRPDILRGFLAARGYNLPPGFTVHED